MNIKKNLLNSIIIRLATKRLVQAVYFLAILAARNLRISLGSAIKGR